MLGGFALATLLLNTAAAIVVYFAYRWWSRGSSPVPRMDWFKKVQPWVDFTQTQLGLIDASMR